MYPICLTVLDESLGPLAVQVFQGRMKENHASGDPTDVQGRTKRIAGSRLAGGNTSENGGGLLNIHAQAWILEHLLMKDAPERGNLVS